MLIATLTLKVLHSPPSQSQPISLVQSKGYRQKPELITEREQVIERCQRCKQRNNLNFQLKHIGFDVDPLCGRQKKVRTEEQIIISWETIGPNGPAVGKLETGPRTEQERN